jgi:hypothetical protein
MAVVHSKGVNFTKQDNPKSTNIIDPGEWGGRVRVQIETFTTVAAEANSTIKVAKLPVGARLLEILIFHGALGTSVTMDVGDENDVDRYGDGLAVATAGVKHLRDADLGQGYKVLGADKTADGKDDQEIMLLILSATADASIPIQVFTYYTQD